MTLTAKASMKKTMTRIRPTWLLLRRLAIEIMPQHLIAMVTITTIKADLIMDFRKRHLRPRIPTMAIVNRVKRTTFTTTSIFISITMHQTRFAVALAPVAKAVIVPIHRLLFDPLDTRNRSPDRISSQWLLLQVLPMSLVKSLMISATLGRRLQKTCGPIRLNSLSRSWHHSSL